MKQTAVEWFYQRILAKDIKEVFEQAKAMEKEQIISSVIYGNTKPSMVSSKILAEQYYNETFKSDQ